MKKMIHWFRQDLRLADNPAFFEASQKGSVLPLFIWDPNQNIGAASCWWLHQSLESLNQSLHGHLHFRKGDPKKVFQQIRETYDIALVTWNRQFEPHQIEQDRDLRKHLEQNGIEVFEGQGFLLWEPGSVSKPNQNPYRVFTPFYEKGCLNAPKPRDPLPKPSPLNLDKSPSPFSLKDLKLLEGKTWSRKFHPHWEVGEEGAWKALQEFLKTRLNGYKLKRNFPSQNNTSRLSPHLHFGEISPHQIWKEIQNQPASPHREHFERELGWREFSYALLHFYPQFSHENFNPSFQSFPWKKRPDFLQAWQKGQTGIPFVDAGMRELWQTGFLHNRLRMVVGSFLVKNLLIHWQEGAEWFEDCLVDADLGNNRAGWQWVAGCGADAAPYFRIFNPILQGVKFDPEGTYTRTYLPELKNLPLKHLFDPWNAPQVVLKTAGIHLGETYPLPIVDLQESRQEALKAFEQIKKTTSAQPLE